MKIADIEVSYIDHCGSDLSVVNAARVSFNKVSAFEKEETIGEDEYGLYTEHVDKLKQSDVKLIAYLAKHKHFSPFNHTFLSFRVKAPIFVARQLVKHKFMPWNEVSRRYVDDEPEFYFPDKWRKRSDNVKQGSSSIPVEYSSNPYWVSDHTEDVLDVYNELLKDGVCPEQARMVLPQNTMTEWVWSGTLGAFCDMLRLRLDPHTQFETQIVAKKIYKEVYERFPVSTNALLGTINE